MADAARAAKVRPGQTIVMLGAAGGVGTVLVQLARHEGIQVIGTAGPRQQDGDRFRAQLREDPGHVMDLPAQGAMTPQMAARFALARAAEALRFAEAGGSTGKVLIVP
jgi:NADPH:quinone reductase-like Zn-dependent oxidoreductase